MRRLALPLLLAAGCAGLSQLAASAVQKPKLTFRSASVQALDLEGATLAFTWDLENPNGFGVDLARVAWTVDVEGTRVAAGDLPGGLKIEANAVAPVTFPVKVRFRDVPGIVSLLGSGKDAVPYKLAGTLGVRTPVGVIDLPISHEDRVKLPAMPHFAVEGIAIRSVSLSTVSLEVRLRVRNLNGFALPPGSLDAALTIAGVSVAQAEGVSIAPVESGASAVVVLPLRLELASASHVAAEVARGGEVHVEVAGTANLGGIPFPLALEGSVPARR